MNEGQDTADPLPHDSEHTYVSYAWEISSSPGHCGSENMTNGDIGSSDQRQTAQILNVTVFCLFVLLFFNKLCHF